MGTGKTVEIDRNACDGCGTCVAVCPQDALDLDDKHPTSPPERCTGCSTCVQACPIGALHTAMLPAPIDHLLCSRARQEGEEEALWGREYDVVVIGGGPAGLMAAWKAASGGASALVLERDREIGIPVRCAEATDADVLRRYGIEQETVVARRMVAQELVAPDGTRVVLNQMGRGVILDRRVFECHIAGLAASQGAEVLTRANAIGMERVGATWDVHLMHHGRPLTCKAKVVVAADGVESRAARWAGVPTALALEDVVSTTQYVLTNIEVEARDHTYLYLGTETAPGGFAWVFPKSGTQANVGLGVLASRANGSTAKQLLDRFVARMFPKAKHTGFVTGGTPVARPLRACVLDGLLVGGDAARLASPVSGEGIRNALISGAVAGEVASSAVREGRWDAWGLRGYRRGCGRDVLRPLEVLYRVKRAIQSMTDADMCRVARTVAGRHGANAGVRHVLSAVVRHDPKLLLELTKLLY